MVFVDKLIQIARADIGVTEDPPGSNWGRKPDHRVRQMIENTGYNIPVYWCDCAVYDWVDRTCDALGFENPMPRTGDCDLTLLKGKKAGLEVFSPAPGDQFFVMATEHDATHTGLVESVRGDGRLVTIEGNSNNDGSNNGVMVAHKPDRRNHNLRFIRWANAVSPGWTLNVGSISIPLILEAGANSVPVRDALKALGYEDAGLAYDPESNALILNGKVIPARAEIRGGKAYVKVRALADFIGQTLKVDNQAKTVAFAKP